MSAPRATAAQLRPLVKKTLERGRDDRPVLLVHADPDAVPVLGPVGGVAVDVRGERSPLSLRALLREHAGDRALVVLTDCEPASLGDDVLARAHRGRVEHLNRWATVCSLFGTTMPSAELAQRKHLADALIEHQPVAGYPPLTRKVLDLDTATATLVRVALGVSDDIADLPSFLRWVRRPEAAGRLNSARGAVLDDVTPALVDRFGPGVAAVLAVLAADRVADLVPLGVAAGAVFAGDEPDVGPSVRLDEWLGRPGLASSTYRAWALAAERVAVDADPGEATGLLDRAASLLRDLGAEHLSHRSDLLPLGYEQRISRAAVLVAEWRSLGAAPLTDPVAITAADGKATQAVDAVASHRANLRSPERCDRLRMAARLVRRGTLGLEGLVDLATAAEAYERDGAWLDAARLSVSRGDPDPELGALCAALTAEADRARHEDGLVFARLARAAGHDLTDVLAVEQVVDRVLTPLAEHGPVLVLVLDGLAWATLTDLVGAIEGNGWVPWRSTGDGLPPHQTAVAALPTVTDRSRASLLCGALTTGDATTERRGFAGHPALLRHCRPGRPPELFHKKELRAGGLDTLPDGVLDAIRDRDRRVVGVVLNNIDERLKDVAQPPAGWTFDDLAPLRVLLDAARDADRTVVLASDHGHILDRDAETRAPAGGGERWRLPQPGPGDGEIEVDGRRVLVDGNRAVLPWAEQLRYSSRHNGYHGGLTPRELFAPLLVLAPDLPAADSGWVGGSFKKPAWWHHLQLRPPALQPGFGAVATTPSAQGSLFDTPAARAAEPVPSAVVPPAMAGPTAPDWFGRLLASPSFVAQRRNPRVRLGDDEVRRLLSVLDAAGGMAVQEVRLAEEADLPAARIARYVAQLQELLNLDGYGVVTTSGREVRLDRDLLARQFEL